MAELFINFSILRDATKLKEKKPYQGKGKGEHNKPNKDVIKMMVHKNHNVEMGDHQKRVMTTPTPNASHQALSLFVMVHIR